MLKVMGLIQRRGDLPLDSFRLHWRTIHRGLALRLAEAGLMAGYVQNHRLDIPAPGLRIAADGVPELWFADEAVFQSMRGHPAHADGVFHDEPQFMQTIGYRSLRLEEEQGEGAARQDCVGLLKAILLLEADDPGLAGAPVRGARQRLLAPHDDIHHVQTSWWADRGAFEAAWSARGRGALGLLAEERVVFWPGDPVPPADWRPIPQTRPR
ncbi:EthD domain-containing protein [Polymorphobacter sp.]|uniref:EthD domain-containing protein n=1 Tax=Polymorphobacter sp. TaxID=1909290 RepID=UPI003F70D930